MERGKVVLVKSMAYLKRKNFKFSSFFFKKWTLLLKSVGRERDIVNFYYVLHETLYDVTRLPGTNDEFFLKGEGI